MVGNEVCGIRNQRGGIRDQKGEIWDHSHGSGIQAMGTGSADFEGSVIRLYHFCGIRDQILTRH